MWTPNKQKFWPPVESIKVSLLREVPQILPMTDTMTEVFLGGGRGAGLSSIDSSAPTPLISMCSKKINY
jgi:hypothetical protein